MIARKPRKGLALKSEKPKLKKANTSLDYFAGLTSNESARLAEFIRNLAATDRHVLFSGESGTGKRELAKLLHSHSDHSSERFTAAASAALSEQDFSPNASTTLQLARPGTVFLDEITDLSLPGQAGLLRFLESCESKAARAKVRFIASTKRDLKRAVAEGKFLEGLDSFLGRYECKVAPLRNRKDDLPVLIRNILVETGGMLELKSVPSLPEKILGKLLAYSWPGNIRQLRAVIERLIILSDGIEVRETDLPDCIQELLTEKHTFPLPTLAEVERRHIQLVLSKERSLTRVAETLGITMVTLWRKRKEYGLS